MKNLRKNIQDILFVHSQSFLQDFQDIFAELAKALNPNLKNLNNQEVVNSCIRDIPTKIHQFHSSKEAIRIQLDMLNWKTYVPVSCTYDDEKMTTIEAIKEWESENISSVGD